MLEKPTRRRKSTGSAITRERVEKGRGRERVEKGRERVEKGRERVEKGT